MPSSNNPYRSEVRTCSTVRPGTSRRSATAGSLNAESRTSSARVTHGVSRFLVIDVSREPMYHTIGLSTTIVFMTSPTDPALFLRCRLWAALYELIPEDAHEEANDYAARLDGEYFALVQDMNAHHA